MDTSFVFGLIIGFLSGITVMFGMRTFSVHRETRQKQKIMAKRYAETGRDPKTGRFPKKTPGVPPREPERYTLHPEASVAGNQSVIKEK